MEVEESENWTMRTRNMLTPFLSFLFCVNIDHSNIKLFQ